MLLGKKYGLFQYASFSINDDRFIIQLEKKIIPEQNIKTVTICDVSFYMLDDNNNPIYSTIKKYKGIEAFKILGIVVNAVIEKIDEYDVFIFSAKKHYDKNIDDFETRNRIYAAIASRLQKMLSIKMFPYDNAKAIHYVLTYAKFTHDEIGVILDKYSW